MGRQSKTGQGKSDWAVKVRLRWKVRLGRESQTGQESQTWGSEGQSDWTGLFGLLGF